MVPRAIGYNLYRGTLSTLAVSGEVRTSEMTQLACGTTADADANDLPDGLDVGVPSPGEGDLYLVAAENLNGEGPIGDLLASVPRRQDAACP